MVHYEASRVWINGIECRMHSNQPAHESAVVGTCNAGVGEVASMDEAGVIRYWSMSGQFLREEKLPIRSRRFSKKSMLLLLPSQLPSPIPRATATKPCSSRYPESTPFKRLKVTNRATSLGASFSPLARLTRPLVSQCKLSIFTVRVRAFCPWHCSTLPVKATICGSADRTRKTFP